MGAIQSESRLAIGTFQTVTWNNRGVAMGEATGDVLGARAGTSALVMFGGAFGYQAMRELVIRGVPGGPGPVPEEEVPDESLEDDLDDFEDFDDTEDSDEFEDLDEFEEDEDEEELGELEDEDEPKYRATPKAGDMIRVVFALRRWLERRGGGAPEPTRDPAAGPAIVALICGWSSTAIHALAAEPLTLAELRQAVHAVDDETTSQVLGELERAGLAALRPGEGEPRYELTEWGREAIAPLIAAACYERLHPAPLALPPDVLDVEAAFQMALPLLELPEDVTGSCRLGVWIPGDEPTMAGATAEVHAGRIASSTPLLEESPETWITGLPLPWCEAAIDPSRREKLKSGGDEKLIDVLLTALHQRLFGNLLGDLGSTGDAAD